MANRGASIPDQLRETTCEDGRTLCRLALDSGVNHSQLERFIQGKQGLALDTAGRGCEVLGVEVRLYKSRGV